MGTLPLQAGFQGEYEFLLIGVATSSLHLIMCILAVLHPPLLFMDEETGWYDGQIWVKNAEVLARDRLLGTFSVKPVLSRLKNTLVVLAASLLVCAITLINLEGNQKNLHDISSEPGGRAVPGVYNDESARSFEPDAFCGEPELQ